MNNIVSNGNTIDYTNSTGSKINSGATVVVGKMCAVAIADIANGETGALLVKGIVDLTKKTTTDTMAVGDVIVYNSGIVKAGTAGVTIGKDIIAGYCVEASSSASTTVRTLLAQ